MVRHCRCCKRRDREIAQLRDQRDRDHEEIARLRVERDELRAQLKDCAAARREAESARDRLAARLQENLKHRFGRRSERAERGEADTPAEPDGSGGAHPGEVRRRGQQPGRPSPRRRSYEHLGACQPWGGRFVNNHCVEASSSFGSLIHAAVGIAGGSGGLRTKRSGWVS